MNNKNKKRMVLVGGIGWHYTASLTFPYKSKYTKNED